MDRRKFLKSSILLIATSLVRINKLLSGSALTEELVMVKNGAPEQMVKKALEMLGSMRKFINRGDVVFIKPNISWDRSPEYAANTHPEVVRTVVEECLNAGAKKVIVADRTCQETKRCYINSGIQEAASKAGADVMYVRDYHFTTVRIPDGIDLKEWEFFKPALEADKYINLPILKHHGLPGITVGLKNTMGIIGGNRGIIHRNFDQKIVDINKVIKPTLTIVDATRILKAHGPQGGRLEDVENANIILAGTDRVLIEAWSAQIFGINPANLGFIKNAYEQGLGRMDINKYKPAVYSFS
ncbi:MAG: DUF362 domain-containing protein [Candidatus Marinimicrobia bacterium]|nr:DUF362 domain-containing protein [Candidatus Neomarinimicrobiota bacterium]